MMHCVDPSKGQLSPPASHGDASHLSDYRYSPVPVSLYTPPRSHPTPQYNYGDPEDYETAVEDPFYEDPGYHGNGLYRMSRLPIHNNMQTRSGRSLRSSRTSRSPSLRRVRSPRPSRRRARCKAKSNSLPIIEPLSEMTKNFDVPVMDMMAWATRSVEQRYQELEKKHKGKIPRPMNSFMLYRTAYKERIKKWGQQGDNNQLISKVAGLSWPLEPQQTKNFYAECAIVERDNHAKAFPNYKFAPNKNLKKRQQNDDDDDSDPEWAGVTNYSGKRGRQTLRDVSRSTTSTPTLTYQSPHMHGSPYHIGHQLAVPNGPVDAWGRPLVYTPGYSQPLPLLYAGRAHLSHAQTPPSMQHAVSSEELYESSLVGLPPAVTGSPMHLSPLVPIEFGIDPSLDELGDLNYQYEVFESDQDPYEQLRYQEAGYSVGTDNCAETGAQMLTSRETSWSATAAGADFERELQSYETGT